MKVVREEIQESKEFVPFRLVIDITTEEELIDLWHRTNIGEKSLRDAYSGKNSYFPVTHTQCSNLWSILEEELSSLHPDIL